MSCGTLAGFRPWGARVMTVWETFAAMRRRWAFVLTGFACTALAVSVVISQPGVYWSRTDVLFLAPSSESYPNVLRTTSEDLIITAGIVAKRINGTQSLTKTATMDVTLMGRGVLDGASIQLPDNGGQWAPNYNEQALTVQVTAATAEEVRERQESILAQISKELDDLQDEAGVADVNRITTAIVPFTAGVQHINGEPKRASAMTVILGGSLTLLAVGLAELWAVRRRAVPAAGGEGYLSNAARARATTSV